VSSGRGFGWGFGVAEVRYLVRDADEALRFYAALGFELVERRGPPFAIVRRGDLTLWLSGPGTSAARTLPDGRQPEPGGWNRFVLQVDDLDATAAALRDLGARFRSEPIAGPGGRQVLVDDPSGNPIELFQPR
jgi:catechol 2,3-dioxygenase-like lactoylglutathione lyase family enzyme